MRYIPVSSQEFRREARKAGDSVIVAINSNGKRSTLELNSNAEVIQHLGWSNTAPPRECLEL